VRRAAQLLLQGRELGERHPFINIYAGGDDGLQQHLGCCFVLLLYRQPNAGVARLNMTIGLC
jgi:hypothetical protein